MKRRLKWISAGVLILVMSSTGIAADKIKVVTTFSDYAAIVKELAGDLVEIESLSFGDQDPHFVAPKPSLALKLKAADMLVYSGMDLEMWLTTLQDKARNRKVMDGAVGFVTVNTGIEILQKPTSFSRSEGDVHVTGNPHFQTSPMSWISISENILIGLKRNDPDNAAVYEANQQAFYESMFGTELVEMFGGDQLKTMLHNGTLFDFLDREFQGAKLIDKLGGWLKKALPIRGINLIAYHKNWAYFVKDFGMTVLGYIEPKPGIPPTPRHVETMINLIEDTGVDIMLVASYFEKRKPTTISERTGIQAIFLPISVDAQPEVPDNFALVDFWIDQILEVLQNPQNQDGGPGRHRERHRGEH